MLNNDAKRVLAFNKSRVLVAVFRSVRAAGSAMKTSPQSISNAANGSSVTSCGLYWRHEHSDFEIEISDIGSLTLVSYDKMCKVERVYNLPKRKKNVKKKTHRDIIQ